MTPMGRPSRARRLLFGAIAAFVAYGLVEVASLAGHFAAYGTLFSFREHTSERRAILATAESYRKRELGAIPVGNPPGSVYEVLHPYLGYVQDPTRTANFSPLGFPDSRLRIHAPDPARVVIGIFGGSFAEGLAYEAGSSLAERLRRSPRFAGKEVIVLRLGMGGYKQPQQMLALAYLLSLGMHFDVVVSLDGLNEVALPVADNLP